MIYKSILTHSQYCPYPHRLKYVQVIQVTAFLIQHRYLDSMNLTTLFLSGGKALKDNYAALIGANYDVRAPDYSYIVIAELTEFYYRKFTIFRTCKDKTMYMLRLLQRSLRWFNHQAIAISSALHTMEDNDILDRSRNLSAFAEHLQHAAKHAIIKCGYIDGYIRLVESQSEEIIDLSGFNKIPLFHEVR